MQRVHPSKEQAKDRPPGRELENDAGANPCFGCGPDNTDGLRLRFFDDGEVIRAPLILDERHSAWEGFANVGVLTTGMLETGGWAVWERLGPARVDPPKFTITQTMPASLGPVVFEARLDQAGQHANVDVVAVQNGQEVARASWTARRATAAEANQVLNFPNLPRSLKPAFEGRAAQRPTTSGESGRAALRGR